ncbi:MAG: archaemetzincin [Myxococcota bacterium]
MHPQPRRHFTLLVVCALVLGAGWDAGLRKRSADLRAEKLTPPYEALKRAATPKRAPHDGEWLAEQPERGESFAEYVMGRPVRGTGLNAFDVQPVGDFTAEQMRVVQLTVQYLRRYFAVPVRLHPTLPAALVPEEARRHHPDTRGEQVFAPWMLEELRTRRPRDSMGLIALTAMDLYPQEDWNYVFGMASLERRVGVWSIHRLCARELAGTAFSRCLLRTIKTAVHELSHMLSLSHCVAYECVMNGSNHLEEMDGQPAEPCPVCLQKLCWNLGCNPAQRSRALIDFAETHGLEELRRELLRRDAWLRATSTAP